MTAEQFTYWLQGFMEINDPVFLGERETQIIKDHLNLIFNKQTPSRTYTVNERNQPNSPTFPSFSGALKITCDTDNPFNDKFDTVNKVIC